MRVRRISKATSMEYLSTQSYAPKPRELLQAPVCSPPDRNSCGVAHGACGVDSESHCLQTTGHIFLVCGVLPRRVWVHMGPFRHRPSTLSIQPFSLQSSHLERGVRTSSHLLPFSFRPRLSKSSKLSFLPSVNPLNPLHRDSLPSNASP